jgi:hypothetical protein
MRGKLWFGAATAALLMFAPAAIAQQADPPADASTEARFTGDAIESALDAAGDADWYRMSVEQGRRYSFTLDAIANEAGDTIDPVLAILDAQGNQLAFNDDANESLNSALSYVPASSGEVFVAVGSFLDSGAGGYRLAATSAEVPPDDAGNDASTRARVSPGRALNGAIEYQGDSDWYRLSAREGQQYRITLRGAEGASEALADPFLRLVGSDGADINMNDDDGQSLNSALTYVPQTSGDVFIVAGAYADAYTGAYTLNVTAERAPSDNLAANARTRGRVNVGDSVDGALEFERDADWYRVRLEEGQSYRFTLAASGSNPLGDPLLRLHDANGQEVAMDDDGGGGLNSYLEFIAPSTGNYFLNAGAFADASTGGYTLSARAGDVPADVNTDASLSADGDYREGVLAPAGDRDWYRIELAEGQGVRLALMTMQGLPDALPDPYITVYGPDGAALVSDDDGGEGLNAWLEFIAPAAGSYFIEARGFAEDAEGRYALSVTAGEIGGSMEGAEYLMPGFESRVSTIHAPGDADWYMIEMIEGRPYRFTLNGIETDALGDPLLTLYDSSNNVVASDDDGGAGMNAYLTYASPTGGSYFAAVSGYGDATGRYELRVIDTDVPGNAYTDEELDAAGDERVSRIDMEGDLDSFRVNLEAGARYTIDVRGHGDSPLADPYLSILNEAGESLASDDDSGPGLDAQLAFTPEVSGVYLIQASGLGGAIGWYQVTVSRQ